MLEMPYGVDFCRERPDALCRDVVAEELQVAHAEYSFVHVKEQSEASQGMEQAPKIALVLHGGGGGHQDVVNINLTHDVVHRPLKSLRRVFEAERHLDEFEEAKRCRNRRLWYVLGEDRDLIIPFHEIDFQKYLASGRPAAKSWM